MKVQVATMVLTERAFHQKEKRMRGWFRAFREKKVLITPFLRFVKCLELYLELISFCLFTTNLACMIYQLYSWENVLYWKMLGTMFWDHSHPNSGTRISFPLFYGSFFFSCFLNKTIYFTKNKVWCESLKYNFTCFHIYFIN